MSIEEARARLHTEIPDKLLNREKECEQITRFIHNALKVSTHGVDGGSDQSLYVSGVPGSGKTACVLKVVVEALTNIPFR